jgi:Zn-dependent protease with chaperone function
MRTIRITGWPALALAALLLVATPGTARAQDAPPDTLQATPDTMAPAGQAEVQAEPAGPGEWTDPGWGEMTPERRQQAVEYSDTKNTLYFVTTFYSFAVLFLFVAVRWSAKIRDWATRVGKKRFFVLALYLLAFTLLFDLINFPFTYYQGFALEHKYGLSNQTFGQWFGELLKGEAVGFVVLLLILWLLYLGIRRSPKRWWVWAGVFAAPITAFFIVVAPILIAPMFNKFTPLENQELKAKILALADKAGISDSRVFQVDASKQSKKYNAYVTGLFGSKRIVLYDTILADMNDDEILFVMGHEMGHYVMHHIWIGVAGVTIFVFLAAFLTARIADRLIAKYGERWGFSQLSDFASVPLLFLLLSIFGFLFQPVSAGMSRYFEHKSDEYGLTMAPNRRAAASAFEKLAAKNLSNPDPSAFIEFWLYDHPTIKDRVEYVLGEKES